MTLYYAKDLVKGGIMFGRSDPSARSSADDGRCLGYVHVAASIPVTELSSYHDVADSSIPATFQCLDCRLRADVSWELIKTTLYSAIMDRQKDLATFRSSLAVIIELVLNTNLGERSRLLNSFIL
jgi:hypothetical protein